MHILPKDKRDEGITQVVCVQGELNSSKKDKLAALSHTAKGRTVCTVESCLCAKHYHGYANDTVGTLIYSVNYVMRSTSF